MYYHGRSYFFLFLFLFSVVGQAEVIFSADFDEQEDWMPAYRGERLEWPGKKTDIDLPGKFDSFYTAERWHPKGDVRGNKGYQKKQPVGQISSDQSRGGNGKSFIVYDESYGSKSQWGADAILGKDLDKNYKELWVEFYIKFQDDWVAHDVKNGKGQSVFKIFRARYVPEDFSGRTRYDFFGYGGARKSPVYMLDLKSWTNPSLSVARLKPFIRGFTLDENIKTDQDNYFLKKYQEETSIKQGGSKSLSFAEIFQGKWTKVGIYIKMDSSPGAEDGIEEVWINDKLEKSRDDIPYRRTGDPENIGFNWIGIGGNAHNLPFPEEDRHEQWYAIDDLIVYSEKR